MAKFSIPTGADELSRNLVLWLCCSVNNLIVDYYLCEHCMNFAVPRLAAMDEISNEVADRPINHINTENMQASFLNLLPDQRLVIYLKIAKGFSNHEIADILSKSIGAVKAIQHHAMIILTHSVFSDSERVIT